MRAFLLPSSKGPLWLFLLTGMSAVPRIVLHQGFLCQIGGVQGSVTLHRCLVLMWAPEVPCSNPAPPPAPHTIDMFTRSLGVSFLTYKMGTLAV